MTVARAFAALLGLLPALPGAAALGEQCSWPPPGGPALHPESDQVEMAPMVADLDGDGLSEIVVLTFVDVNDDGPGFDGILRILRGSDCAEVATTVDPGCVTCFGEPACASLDVSGEHGVLCPGCGVALADLDDDGLLEIVAVSEGNDADIADRRLVVFDHAGSFLRCTELSPRRVGAATPPLVADLDADGEPELVARTSAWSSSGALLWSQPATGIGLVTAADLDADGSMEVLSGEAAYRSDGSLLWHRSDLALGSPAVADFDLDCVPEVVVSSRNRQEVHVLDGPTGVTRASAPIPAGDCPPRSDGQGGPPTLADTDGDCVPEIGIAGCRRYALWRWGSAPDALSLLWESPTDDSSSRFTGSAIFDLDADGTAEVLYNDHELFRVYDAVTGAVEQQLVNSTFTLVEYPVVADVDADGRAEVVLAANDYVVGSDFGVRVIHDDAVPWAFAPPLFNEHAFHVTNVLPDGRIPAVEEPSWARYNTFRVQGPPLRSDEGPELLGVPPDAAADCAAVPAPATPTATGGCGDVPAVAFSESGAAGGCGPLHRTWTATDRCGRTATRTQVLTVTDSDPPALSGVPADETLPCHATLPPAAVGATDGCDAAPVVTATQAETGDACARTVTRTWVGRDACGNETTATQVVTFTDGDPPALSGVPADETLPCDATLPPATVTAADACDAAPMVTSAQVEAGGPCLRTVTRTWTGSDSCGHAAAATQVVTFADEAPPALSGVPADVTVTCSAVPPPAAPSAADTCTTATVSFAEVRIDGPCPDAYALHRTWTASDECGHSVSSMQVVTVLEGPPPSLVGVPADATVECDAIPPPAAVTASSSCDPAPLLSFVEERIDGRCAGEHDLVRRWTATDRCGRTATAAQVVHVVDRTPPAIAGFQSSCLWSPNHWVACLDPSDFHPSVADACGAATWRFAGCASDQPDDALGDGAFVPDCVVDAEGRLCIRSERQGMIPPGRRYGVLAIAVDDCGNESAPTPIGDVWIPRDQREHPDCLKIQDVADKGHGRPGDRPRP